MCVIPESRCKESSAVLRCVYIASSVTVQLPTFQNILRIPAIMLCLGHHSIAHAVYWIVVVFAEGSRLLPRASQVGRDKGIGGLTGGLEGAGGGSEGVQQGVLTGSPAGFDLGARP